MGTYQPNYFQWTERTREQVCERHTNDEEIKDVPGRGEEVLTHGQQLDEGLQGEDNGEDLKEVNVERNN